MFLDPNFKKIASSESNIATIYYCFCPFLIVGVTGSIMFPFLRKCMGLAKTGIFGFISLISCLSLCVVSIFLNGSPFDPYYYQYSYKNYNQTAEVIPNPKVEEITAEDCFTSSYLSVGILIAGMYHKLK